MPGTVTFNIIDRDPFSVAYDVLSSISIIELESLTFRETVYYNLIGYFMKWLTDNNFDFVPDNKCGIGFLVENLDDGNKYLALINKGLERYNDEQYQYYLDNKDSDGFIIYADDYNPSDWSKLYIGSSAGFIIINYYNINYLNLS